MVAGIFRIAVAGNGVDDAIWCDSPDQGVPRIGNVQVSLRIDGETHG
jgi:hypothetical protein